MAHRRIGPMYRNIMNCILVSIILVSIPTSGGEGGTQTEITTIPPVKQIILESTKAVLSFSISAEYEYSKDLQNTDSATYINYSSEFLHKLMDTFHGTPGLEGIDHIRFRNGSIDYDVVLNRADRPNVLQSLSYINGTKLDNLQIINIGNDSFNITAMLIDMRSKLANLITNINSLNICDILVNPCDFGYECIIHGERASCRDKCQSDPPLCSNGGKCYVDYKYKNLSCQCHDTDEYVFTGYLCEVRIKKVQSLPLSAKEYAIIAGSAAGAVVLVLIFVHLIRCLRKRSKRRKEDNAHSDVKSNLSVAHVSVRMSELNEPDFDNTTYVYDSGLPEMRRNHRIYRDPHTEEEAIIYQPTFVTIPMPRGNIERESAHSEHMSRLPVYNKDDKNQNDTKNNYKLKRPNLKEHRN